MPAEPLAPAAPAPRPDRAAESPLTVWIPKALHRQLKIATAKEGVTIKEYVLRKLMEELGQP
jgi:predicted HicB family RNase H-like nuclease